MTPDKTKRAFEACAEMILAYDGSLRPSKASSRDDGTLGCERREHALWMCAEGQRLIDEGRIEKAMRWLGFVQGVMWCELSVSIDDMKAINMPEVTLDSRPHDEDG